MEPKFAFAGDQAVGSIIAQRLQEAGYVLADGLATADCVFTYCLAQSQLEDVYLGTGGLLEAAAEGSVLVDLSPSTPTLAKEVYALARVNEMQALDAPLVLADPCVHDAFGDSANVMLPVGGEEAAFEDALPLLRALAGEVRHAGPAGAGQLAKAMCTLQQISALVALVECHALAKTQGDGALEWMAACTAAGMATGASGRLYRAIAERHFDGTHTCQVLMAEITAVMNAADDADLVLPQAEACQHLLELFLVVGGGDMAAPALSLVYADDEECRAHGLEWSRAEGLYGHGDHGHRHDLGAEGEDEYREYGFDYGFDDEDGYAGFGGFSSN